MIATRSRCNLLNKNKEAPSAIKESSESSQTIDDADSDKGGLKHENTVVRVDTATSQSAPPVAAAVASMTALARQAPPSSSPSTKQEIMRVTQSLLDSVAVGDYEAYVKLCDPNMTCFEPEALGNLVQGMEFHKFYFDATVGSSRTKASTSATHTTMLNPQVHMLGDDAAAVCYIRLTQYIDKSGEARTRQSQETRVWHKRPQRGWQCVHLHRSGAPSSTLAADTR